MAGDWIPVTLELPRKREVLALAAATGLSTREVMAIVIEFWMWAQGETADGQLPRVTLSMLPGVIHGTTPEFWREMVAVGWLQEQNGGLQLPNAEKWLSRGAKARLLKTQRQAEWRGKLAVVPKNGAPPNAKPAKPKEPRPTKRPPTDFCLTPERLQFAVEDGLDKFQAEREFEKFKDHSFAGAKSDWDATWRNWCRTATDRQHRLPPAAPASRTQPPPAKAVFEKWKTT